MDIEQNAENLHAAEDVTVGKTGRKLTKKFQVQSVKSPDDPPLFLLDEESQRLTSGASALPTFEITNGTSYDEEDGKCVLFKIPIDEDHEDSAASDDSNITSPGKAHSSKGRTTSTQVRVKENGENNVVADSSPGSQSSESTAEANSTDETEDTLAQPIQFRKERNRLMKFDDSFKDRAQIKYSKTDDIEAGGAVADIFIPVPDKADVEELRHSHSNLQRSSNDEYYPSITGAQSLSHYETQLSINKLIKERHKPGASLATVGRVFGKKQKELDDLKPHYELPTKKNAEKRQKCKCQPIHACVIILFIIIISTTIITLKLYQSTQEKLAADLGFVFDYKTRELGVYPYQDLADLSSSKVEFKFKAYLGPAVPAGLPFNCSDKYKHPTAGEVNTSHAHVNNIHYCYRWDSSYTLNLTQEPLANSTGMCMKVLWVTEKYQPQLEDCMDLDPQFGDWYGGFLQDDKFSLRDTIIAQSSYQPGKTFGTMTERFWVSTNGMSIVVPDGLPLYVSIRNHEVGTEVKKTKKTLCLSSWYGYSGGTRQLEYYICRAPSMQESYQTVRKRFYPVMEESQSRKIFEQFTYPVITRSDVSTDPSVNYSFILSTNINPLFETDTGSGTPSDGVRISLYIPAKDPAFFNDIDSSKWLPSADMDAPQLFNHNNVTSAMLVPNEETIRYINTKIPTSKLLLIDEVMPGDLRVSNYPFNETRTTFQNFIPRLIDIHKNRTEPILTASASALTNTPVIFNIPPTKDVASLVRYMLQASLSGYKLISSPEINGNLSDVEFIRYAQVASFLPVFRVSADVFLNRTREFYSNYDSVLKLREKALIKLREALFDKPYEPTYKPVLWMDPTNTTVDISDQFIIGDFMIVPITDAFSSERKVYFPKGDWVRTEFFLPTRRTYSRKFFKGPKLETLYDISLDEILAFQYANYN